jgi:signal transduction histidine kinase/WD40 repeat protein
VNPEFTSTPSPAPTEEELLRRREALRRGLRRANFAWVVIVAVIAALTFGVVWKARQSAREAERANHNANQAAQEAARANAEAARAEAELWNARFTQARATRSAGGPGARVKSSRIIAELARHPNLTEQQRLALRTEVIAQLALVDVELPPDLNARLIKDQPVWDANLARYTPGVGANDVEIFESSSGKVLATFPVPRGFRRQGMVFSPDGRFLAGVFRRNASRVMAWRLADGALVVSNQTVSVEGYDLPVFSEDGRTLAIYTARALELHSLESNTPPRLFPRPVKACFSPDSKSLAVVVRTSVEMWSATTGAVRARVSPGFSPQTVIWHPDGSRVAVGGSQGDLILWEPPNTSSDGRTPAEGGPIVRLDGHAGTIVTLQFSPDGSLLLSSAWDGFASLWEVRGGRRLLTESLASYLMFSPDGRRLVVQAKRNGGRLVTPLLGRTGFRSVLQSGRVGKHADGVAFSRDGRFAATDYHGSDALSDFTRLWDADTGRELARLPGRTPAFLPDNDSLLTSCAGSGVFRFDLRSSTLAAGGSNWLAGEKVLRQDRGSPMFHSLSLASDDRTLVVSVTDAGVVLFDLAGERPLRRLTNIVAQYASLSADGDWLMTQVHNGVAHLVSLTNASRPRPIGMHMNTAFSPDGRRLALSTEETLTLAERNATNGWSRTARVPLELGGGVVAQLAFSPDSRVLAVNTNRIEIHLLDARDARVLATFIPPFDKAIGGGRSLSFSPDGRFLRALLHDREVVEWDLPVVRTELAKLGLDWAEATPASAVTKAAELVGVRPSPGAETDKPARALESSRTAGRSNLAAPGDGRTPGMFSGDSLPAVIAGAAGLLALAAGVFVFAHQRRLLAGYAQAERLAAERQQQLGQAQQALFQGQKMEALGTLAAGVAHDFNNLLSIIRMSNQLVARSVKPEGLTKENLDAVEQAVQQGKSIINSMLGYSRRPTEAIEDFTVAKVVGDTVALLSRQFLSGLTLNLQLDPSCPPVYGSRARLEQALLNLLVNASEAMNGSGTLTLSVRSAEPSVGPVLAPKPASAYVAVCVADSGPGIAEEVLPRIFEPFFTTKNAGSDRGTGLGLSLVYTIARQDGWGLEVQTSPGRGTSFSLLLPASQTDLLSGRRLPTSPAKDLSSKVRPR